MKHGIKLRKLQRTSSHRYALLRNLVSALLHHEMIKTTVPKAKEAARMAEKMITLGKKGTDPARRSAQAFLMPGHHYSSAAFESQRVAPTTAPGAYEDPEGFKAPTSLLPKVFDTLAERYADRPGGYTRIQKFGKRPGDNAPVALLSLVDGPRDLKFEMAARAAARESVQLLRDGKPVARPDATEALRPRTARNVERVTKFRGEQGKKLFEDKQAEYMQRLRAEANFPSDTLGHRRAAPPARFPFRKQSLTRPMAGRRVLAGERLPGMSTAHTGLGLARAALASPRNPAHADRTPLYAGERPGPSPLDVD